jgi:transposase
MYLDEKRKLGIVKRMRRQIEKYGVTSEDLSFVTV